MSGQERLIITSLIVAAFVIIGLAAVFSFLFFLYSFYKVKQIKFGFEDISLTKEVKENTYKRNKKRRKENKTFLSLKEALKEEERVNAKLHILMNVFSSIIIIALLGLFSLGLTYRVNNDNLFINDVTYLTILTSSMEDKNEKNEYLFDNNLNNQITQYSLVGIEKVEDVKDIKLYDVLAYKHEDIIILHRVIDIYTDDEDPSIICFKLRGDSNASSLSYEEKICKDDIIGRYTGFNNYGLGVFLTYIKSEIGFIAILGAAIFLFLAGIAEEKINKQYKTRILYLIDNHCLLSESEYKFLINNNIEEEINEINKNNDSSISFLSLNDDIYHLNDKNKEIEEENNIENSNDSSNNISEDIITIGKDNNSEEK